MLSNEATITGKLTSKSKLRMYVGSNNVHYPTVTFENDIVLEGNNQFRIYPYGTAIFKGCSSASRMYLGTANSAKGSVEFHSSSNNTDLVATYSADILFKARDVFA